MQPDAIQSPLHAAISPASSARHPVAQAVREMAHPFPSHLDQAAARGRLREVVTSYVRALRADGATVTDILTATNAIARRTLSGLVPTRAAAEIRDTIRRWAAAAYERAD